SRARASRDSLAPAAECLVAQTEAIPSFLLQRCRARSQFQKMRAAGLQERTVAPVACDQRQALRELRSLCSARHVGPTTIQPHSRTQSTIQEQQRPAT